MALRTLNTNHLFFCWAWLAMLAGNNLMFSFLFTRRLYVWYPWWHNVGLSLGCSCWTSHLLFTVSSAVAAGKEWGDTRAFNPSLCCFSLELLWCSLTCSQSPFYLCLWQDLVPGEESDRSVKSFISHGVACSVSNPFSVSLDLPQSDR